VKKPRYRRNPGSTGPTPYYCRLASHCAAGQRFFSLFIDLCQDLAHELRVNPLDLKLPAQAMRSHWFRLYAAPGPRDGKSSIIQVSFFFQSIDGCLRFGLPKPLTRQPAGQLRTRSVPSSKEAHADFVRRLRRLGPQ
jgi:hypothetical protein